jgi:uncharacterized protein (DUF3084 family)
VASDSPDFAPVFRGHDRAEVDAAIADLQVQFARAHELVQTAEERLTEIGVERDAVASYLQGLRHVPDQAQRDHQPDRGDGKAHDGDHP